jgi:5-methyltetrahydrofolate--homocysteine methyltransferase
MSPEKLKFIEQWQQRIEKWTETIVEKSGGQEIEHSKIKPVTPPTPPHLNKKIRLEPGDIDLNEVWKFLDKKSLFVLSWGLRGKSAKDSEAEHEILFEEWKKKILAEKLFEPRAVYGYFKCHGKDGSLTVDHPNGEKLVFEFPRSSRAKHLCLADYFGQDDVVAFQAVTVGNKASEIIEQWNKEDKYTDAYYLHGLAVETAEAMAAWINQRIKDELKIGGKCGLRYSWGYPSCPDVSQHYIVWKLLEPEKSGMALTESGQIMPEQSTAAIIVHHPEAEYFAL